LINQLKDSKKKIVGALQLSHFEYQRGLADFRHSIAHVTMLEQVAEGRFWFLVREVREKFPGVDINSIPFDLGFVFKLLP